MTAPQIVSYALARPGELPVPTRHAERLLAYVAAHPGCSATHAAAAAGVIDGRYAAELDQLGYITRGRRSHTRPLTITPLGTAWLHIAAGRPLTATLPTKD